MKGIKMHEVYVTDKAFEKNEFIQNSLTTGEYENCIFRNCNFANGDLSASKFIDCRFEGCNLSLSTLNKTALREVNFKDCKMLGLRFDNCLDFGLSFSFDGCQLNHCSFYRTKIRNTVFRNSQLRETDFTNCDLSNVIFDNCDLAGALFDHTILEKADFRTSYNYSLDPEINRIKKAKFSIAGVAGLLGKYDIDIEY
ncbi:pentapeptide repeat-containing protein [Parapedobacter indicus]|nr:pentapeptide repeat-containing protein [Parapedobacter indicus]